MLGYALLVLGACIALLNFYLSFLRYPLYKLLGWDYWWVSGLPLVGSLFLVTSAVILRDWPPLFWGGLGLAVLDTGGLHWFLGIMLWHRALRCRRDQSL